MKLKACPFCGGVPDVLHIGNEHTEKRKIKVRCPECRIERTDAAIYHGFDFLEKFAEKNWNKRIQHEKNKEHTNIRKE